MCDEVADAHAGEGEGFGEGAADGEVGELGDERDDIARGEVDVSLGQLHGSFPNTHVDAFDHAYTCKFPAWRVPDPIVAVDEINFGPA